MTTTKAKNPPARKVAPASTELPLEVDRKVRALCAKFDRRRAWVLRQAVIEYVKNPNLS